MGSHILSLMDDLICSVFLHNFCKLNLTLVPDKKDFHILQYKTKRSNCSRFTWFLALVSQLLRDSPMYILNKAIEWMVSNMYLYLKCDTRIVIYFFFVCSFEMILFWTTWHWLPKPVKQYLIILLRPMFLGQVKGYKLMILFWTTWHRLPKPVKQYLIILLRPMFLGQVKGYKLFVYNLQVAVNK